MRNFSQYLPLLICSVVLSNISCAPAAHAAPTGGPRILIVDAGHTQTGHMCFKTLANIPDPKALFIVDAKQLPEESNGQWNAVIWVGPEPQLYKDNVRQAWERIVASHAGICFIGLPHTEPGQKAFFAAIANRGGAEKGIHIEKHLENANWIWTSKSKDNQTIYLRKTFDLKDVPPRAWIQCNADNLGKISVNGTFIGSADNWRKPESYDVTRLLHAGKNLISVEASNEDGPAGILLGLAGFNPAGQVVLDVNTDKTWKASETAAAGWNAAVDFDDSAWEPAKEVAEAGGGYWEEKLFVDYRSQEYQVHISGDHPAVAGISGSIGRAVILDGLKPGSGAATILSADEIPVAVAGEGAAGRMVLLSSDPESTTLTGKERALLQSNGFGDFLLQSTHWLATGANQAVLSDARIPETTAGGSQLTIQGRLTSAADVTVTLRDDKHALSDSTSNHPAGDFKIPVTIPNSWETANPLILTIVARNPGDNAISVRTGTITLLDPVQFTFDAPSKRWVYRSSEAVNLQATLAPGQTPPVGHLEGAVLDSSGKSAAPLGAQTFVDGKATWSVGLKDLKPGAYFAQLRYLADGSKQILSQQRWRFDIVEPASATADFPVCIQFTQIPYEAALLPARLPESDEALRQVVDNMIDHGTTCFYTPTPLPHEQARYVEGYAQSKGLSVLHWYERPAEIFSRDEPPKNSLYSKKYDQEIKEKLTQMLPLLDAYPRLIYAYPYRDEPFHNGFKSFMRGDDEILEFQRLYNYTPPIDPEAARTNPELWQRLLTYQSDYWKVGWKKVFKQLKEMNSSFLVGENHDSHSTYGGGAGQDGKINIDDVWHWGADWFDAVSYDIYPYLMTDYRYGPNRHEKLPRMAPTHYTFSFMRDLAYSNKKHLGFFFGTYNPEWYDLPETAKDQYWLERESVYTALAQGADYLVAGINIPIEAKHWEDLGEGLNVLKKVGPQLEQTRKVKARAAMIYPRTQTLQLQEEYFNVSQSYEAFLRAFGELDLIHEEQVEAGDLKDYQILVMFDVKLLSSKAAEKVEQFVHDGGTVIADCVPTMDENRLTTDRMEKVFGVKNPQQARILWPAEVRYMVPVTQPAPKKSRVPGSTPKSTSKPATKTATKPVIRRAATMRAMPDSYRDEPATRPSASLTGNALGIDVDIPLVSPRAATMTSGEVLLKTSTGEIGLVKSTFGKGHAYLLGFCLQDTDYGTWHLHQDTQRAQLLSLLGAIANDAGVHSHIFSSNPDIEAAIRVSDKDAFIVVVSHEAKTPQTQITVRDRSISKITNVETGQEIPIEQKDGSTMFNISAPTGATYLLKVQP